ncbi:MAG: hypothetical protein AAEJ47_11425, partial [Planctomycetota bacterium]
MRVRALSVLFCIACTLIGGTPVTAQVADLLVAPYLQSPTPTSMVVGWETQGSSQSQVEYGLSSALGLSASGTSVAS